MDRDGTLLWIDMSEDCQSRSNPRVELEATQAIFD
jgi:hypothetical protein